MSRQSFHLACSCSEKVLWSSLVLCRRSIRFQGPFHKAASSMASSLSGARAFRCWTGLTADDGYSTIFRRVMLAQSAMPASPLRATPRSSCAQLRSGTEQPASQGRRSGARQRYRAENISAISATSQSSGSSTVGVGVFPAGAPLTMRPSAPCAMPADFACLDTFRL